MKILSEILKLYGLAEISGPKSNPELLTILNKHIESADDSETAWCGIMMGEAFDRAGFSKLKPMNYPGARTWLKVGEPIDLGDAGVGPDHTDVVVFWRDSPGGWKGHVGIFIAKNDKNIFVLSGNQSNMVNISPYGIDRLLGVRRIKET